MTTQRPRDLSPENRLRNPKKDFRGLRTKFRTALNKLLKLTGLRFKYRTDITRPRYGGRIGNVLVVRVHEGEPSELEKVVQSNFPQGYEGLLIQVDDFVVRGSNEDQ